LLAYLRWKFDIGRSSKFENSGLQSCPLPGKRAARIGCISRSAAAKQQTRIKGTWVLVELETQTDSNISLIPPLLSTEVKKVRTYFHTWCNFSIESTMKLSGSKWSKVTWTRMWNLRGAPAAPIICLPPLAHHLMLGRFPNSQNCGLPNCPEKAGKLCL